MNGPRAPGRPARRAHPPLRRHMRARRRHARHPERLHGRADRAGRRRQIVAARHRRRRPPHPDRPGRGARRRHGRRAPSRLRSAPRIAYMPQGLGKNLYPDLSVRENIEFFGRLFGQSRDERDRRIAELLDSTGLAPFPDRPARKLSGGMRQKLGLCCALIHDPDLLILDEPTTGVDPLSRRQFWDLIDACVRRRPGMSVMVATAYMEEAERFDWLVAMNAGRVLATGSPARNQGAHRRDHGRGCVHRAACRSAARRRPRPAIPPRRPGDHEAVIVARDLTCRFGDFTAVDRVSFTIERGEIFGFLGSNGCGKTTTMKMLTGLLPATSGEALLFGRADRCRRHALAQPRRLHVAVVFALHRADGPSESRSACAAVPSAARQGEAADRRAGPVASDLVRLSRSARVGACRWASASGCRSRSRSSTSRRCSSSTSRHPGSIRWRATSSGRC